MGREQRRVDAISALREVIDTWVDDFEMVVPREALGHDPADELAARLFELQPAYCPYDSGCHDDECPCPNCAPPCCHPGSGCAPPAYPCCDTCPLAGDG